MPIRWVINPVVTVSIIDTESGQEVGGHRAPKVATLIDPGRGKPYMHSSAISTGNWALSFVRGVLFMPVDADAEIVNLFETNFNDVIHLTQTPRQLGWNNARLTRIKNRLTAKGTDVTGITLDTPLETILDRAAQIIGTWFRARGLQIEGP